MVTLNHRDRSAISEGLLELDRINDVGKKQSQQPSAMLDRDLCNSPAATSARVRKSVVVTNRKMEQREERLLHTWPFRSKRADNISKRVLI
jgi:hypothetical protein